MVVRRKEFFTPAAKAARLVKIRLEDGEYLTVPRANLTPEQRKQADKTATDLLRHLLSNGILPGQKN